MGIANIGSSCYFNALISVLASFSDFLPPITASSNPYDVKLHQMIDDLHQGRDTVGQSLRADNFFYAGQQDDPFIAVIEKITLNNNINSATNVSRNYNEEHPELGLLTENVTTIQKYAIPYLEFEMQSAGKAITSLNASLNDYLKKEILSHPRNDLYPLYTQEVSKSLFTDEPKYLLVQLKRFTVVDFDKNGRAIFEKLSHNYTLTQKFSLPFFDVSSEKEGEFELPSLPEYKLVATVNHVGSANGGHYYSYINHGKNQWKKHDDQKISDVASINDVLQNSTSYLLLFIKSN